MSMNIDGTDLNLNRMGIQKVDKSTFNLSFGKRDAEVNGETISVTDYVGLSISKTGALKSENSKAETSEDKDETVEATDTVKLKKGGVSSKREPWEDMDIDGKKYGDFVKDLNKMFPSYESKFSLSVDSQEEAILLEQQFIRVTGIAHCEMEDKIHNVQFTAYFGQWDFKTALNEGEKPADLSHSPVFIVAFAECTNDKTQDDVNNAADYIAQHIEYGEPEF